MRRYERGGKNWGDEMWKRERKRGRKGGEGEKEVGGKGKQREVGGRRKEGRRGEYGRRKGGGR